MKTNRYEQPTMSLTNRVLAVVDDVRVAREAIRQLDASGVPEGHVDTLSGDVGLHRIDAHGTYGGRLTRFVRAVQSVSIEGEHLRRYEAELEQGRLVVDVPVLHAWNRQRVVDILRAQGAHFINAYGQWTIEPMAA